MKSSCSRPQNRLNVERYSYPALILPLLTAFAGFVLLSSGCQNLPATPNGGSTNNNGTIPSPSPSAFSGVQGNWILRTVSGSFAKDFERECLALDSLSNFYFTTGNSVWKLSPNGELTKIAGTGAQGFSGDGGPATSATMNGPKGVAIDSSGNVLIADTYNERIRKVTPDGNITTIVGNGVYGEGGDGGPASSAQLCSPMGFAVDSAGNIFIPTGNRIRKVGTDGIITTLAGAGPEGYSGDGGPATAALLAYPTDLCLDSAGNVLFGDKGNNRVRKVSTNGTITTIAGSGTWGFKGDGGPATLAALRNPERTAVDSGGNVYVADNNRIRKITPNGNILTVVGSGNNTFAGEGEAAASASISSIRGMTVDPSGSLYFAMVAYYIGQVDWTESRICKVSP